MKNYNILLTWLFFALLSIGLLVGCEDDSIEPSIEGVAIEDTDLLQVDDGNPNITVSFTAKSSDLNSVQVTVSPEGSSSSVYSNTLSKIISDQLNRVKISVPFPTPDIAPSGVYDITFKLNGSDSNTSSYKINVLNNRTIKYCEFPAAPAGKVAVFVSVPGGADVTAAGKSIYITGNFEADNGGSDWSGGGNEKFKLTKLGDQCYYIFLDKLDKDKLFKFTLGDWGQEFLDAKGAVPSNLVAPGGNVSVNVYNFKTLPIKEYIVPEVLPSEAIVTGHNTTIVNVGTVDKDAKYYLIEKGATSLTDARQMYPVSGTAKLAVAIPKNSIGKEFQIVKGEIDNIAAVSANEFGFDPVPYSFEIAEETNPMTVAENAIGFSKELQKSYETFLLVGGATPAGWNNSESNTQLFTKESDTKFSITIDLQDSGSGGYLIIPNIGSWDVKIGRKTDGDGILSGDLAFGGKDFLPPTTPGTYKMEIDLVTATYTLTLQ